MPLGHPIPIPMAPFCNSNDSRQCRTLLWEGVKVLWTTPVEQGWRWSEELRKRPYWLIPLQTHEVENKVVTVGSDGSASLRFPFIKEAHSDEVSSFSNEGGIY